MTEEQSLAIQRDYAMKGGRREIDVRLSKAYYFIMRMSLDLSDLRANLPEQHRGGKLK
ncbi:hypothetical protein [Gluconobacter cerinus]|uniref:hypothetical protein n=1 Tax=Gluconobacter cerinus TaxID=38307 RepID=UPI001B8D74AF|nr:hypothetical protein [Gluconobacter cerinus]MBS0995114.1 hypothetical protein [Gluconobacter cerinus]